MPIDAGLLAEARAAEERLIDAEHAADLARADFHRAVRRLQLGGASMREAAAALGLSHQRVHQIVEAAGGSRRWPRGRDRSKPRSCSFCGHEYVEAKTLVAGPGVFICGRCVEAAVGVLDSGHAATTPITVIERVEGDERSARCSFCGKRRDEVAGLAVAPGGRGDPRRKWPGHLHICNDCLRLCREIIEEQLS
jgi:bacterioferritin-associated ferredoxin